MTARETNSMQGPRSMLFIPDLAFELIVKRQIARLADPAQRCVDLVFEELMRVAAMAEAQVRAGK
mgnify:FL=1